MIQDCQPIQERIIGYLGPRGTHSEEIAFGLYKGEWGRFIPYSGIDAVIRAVDTGEVSECVVPLENSLEGSVNITLDTLAHETEVAISREVIWPIRNDLLIKEDTKHIHVILSHSQALAQCRQYINTHYPDAEVKAVESTAEAAYIVASGAKYHAAIGSSRAGQIYGLTTVAANIQDHPNNCTRFVVLGKNQVLPKAKRCKTSIMCQINGEKPGSLCEILQEFANRGVNLTKIESRPARTGLGDYIFFLDMEGSQEDENVQSAIAAVQLSSRWFKNFGSYEVYTIQNS